jgi:hypothetical protein
MDDDSYTIEGRKYKAISRKAAEAQHQQYKKRQLPTWLTMESLGLDPEYDDRGRYALEESKRKRGENSISTCQTPSKSMQPRLTEKGYVRAHMYPPTPAGKKQAIKKEIEYREDNAQVQVHRMYCHDADPKGNYWTVWVQPYEKGTRESAGGGGSGHKSAGTFYARGARRYEEKRRATSGGWYALRPEARAAVSCPKCNAPIGKTCVTALYVEEDGELVRYGKPTNSHRQRVEKYLEESGRTLKDVEEEDYKARKITETKRRRDEDAV